MRAITRGPADEATEVPGTELEAAEEWAPAIVTPGRNIQEWAWSQQVRPPYIADTVQEPWSKAVAPIRAVALFLLWITWHWTRCAALAVVLALVVVLVLLA